MYGFSVFGRYCFFVSVVSLAGCSVLLDVGGQQCDSNSDCTKAGFGTRCEANVCVGSAQTADGGVDGGDEKPKPNDGTCKDDDDCAGSETPSCMRGTCVTEELATRFICDRTAPQIESKKIHYSFKVVDFVAQTGRPGVSANACRTNDPACTSPLAKYTVPDDSGLVEFDLPMGFLGFFEVYSAGGIDALSYLSKPIYADTVDRDLQIPSPEQVNLLATLEGYVYDPTKGVAMVEAFDCEQKPVGGVHFTESRGTATGFYLVDHLPNKEANVSVYDAVNNIADGGFLNVQPGYVTFTARWGVDGPAIGAFNAAVRENTLTFLDMYF